MSMSLDPLPLELYSCVVAHIASPFTLCKLARCSRQLYLWTVPYLYRHISIDEGVRKGTLQGTKLRRLASLLIRRPDLASLVRQFRLHHYPVHGCAGCPFPYHSVLGLLEESDEEPEAIKVNPAFWRAFNAWNLSKEERKPWLRRLNCAYEDDHEFFIALLLPSLLNLEKLDLDFELEILDPFIPAIMRRAAYRLRPFNIQPPFKALTVFIQPQNMSVDTIASLLKLPAIQKISGSTWGQGATGRNSDLVKLKSFSSPLTSLDLSSQFLSAEALGYILRAPKALKAFFYRFPNPKYHNFELTDIRHALRPQEDSLESLSLDLEERYNWEEIYDGTSRDWGPMTSYLGFKNLKFLKTAALFLENTENGTARDRLINIFPPNLETLHLTRFEVGFEGLQEALHYLLLQKSLQQIPSLRKIILDETGSIGVTGKFRRFKRFRSPRSPAEFVIGRLHSVAADQGVFIDAIEK